MPTAEISTEAHQAAKEQDGTIGEVVDEWYDKAGTLDATMIVNPATDVIHKPTVTPHGHLEAECHAPNDETWIAIGPTQAQAIIEEAGGELCEICHDP